MPDQVTYKLKRAIELKNVEGAVVHTVTEFKLRTEVCAGDLRGGPMRNPMWADDILRMIERLSGQPTKVVDKLSPDDFDHLGDLVLGFFKPSPAGAPDSEPGSGGTTGSP